MCTLSVATLCYMCAFAWLQASLQIRHFDERQVSLTRRFERWRISLVHSSWWGLGLCIRLFIELCVVDLERRCAWCWGSWLHAACSDRRCGRCCERLPLQISGGTSLHCACDSPHNQSIIRLLLRVALFGCRYLHCDTQRTIMLIRGTAVGPAETWSQEAGGKRTPVDWRGRHCDRCTQASLRGGGEQPRVRSAPTARPPDVVIGCHFGFLFNLFLIASWRPTVMVSLNSFLLYLCGIRSCHSFVVIASFDLHFHGHLYQW